VKWLFAQLGGVDIPKVEANEASLRTAINFMFQLAAALALVYVIISAIRFTISAGDPQQIANARRTLIYALVGLGISVTALAITSIVQGVANRAAGEANPFFGGDGVITQLVDQLSFAVGVASVIMVIIGAFRFVTSGGQSQSAQGARDTIIYALIGLGVAIAGRLIVTFVLGRI